MPYKLIAFGFLLIAIISNRSFADDPVKSLDIDDSLAQAISEANASISLNPHGWSRCAALAFDLSALHPDNEYYPTIAIYSQRRSEIENDDVYNERWNSGFMYLWLEYKPVQIDYNKYSEYYSYFNEQLIDTADIISLWKSYAALGDPIAMYYLASAYNKANMPSLSLRWMRAAAEAGVFRAQQILFYMYRYGTGHKETDIQPNHIQYENKVEYDYNESLRWLYRQSAQSPTHGLNAMNRIIFSLSISTLSDVAAILNDNTPAIEQGQVLRRNHAYYIASNSPCWPLDVNVLQQAYVISHYEYMNANDEISSKGAHIKTKQVLKFMSKYEQESAIHVAETWHPRIELDPIYPLADQPSKPLLLSQLLRDVTDRNKPMSNTPIPEFIDGDIFEIEQSRLQLERDSFKQTERHMNVHLAAQAEALDEQKRVNSINEQHNQAQDNIRAMQILTDLLNRQYPIRDPLAPGTRANPVIIEHNR